MPATVYAGLRRSSYGLRERNADHDWWIARTREFASAFEGAAPVVVQIVSVYQDDGTTRFDIPRPAGYTGTTEGMSFGRGVVDHDRALTAYDRAGIRAILQVEPGSADVPGCLEVARRALGGHPCVIGYGVDCEWYRCKDSPGGRGMPVGDAEARAWMEKAGSLDPNSVLFLKHWDARHMPPTYRYPRLLFFSDSQGFGSLEEMLADFRTWAGRFAGSVTGYQFGYRKDRRWWDRMPQPPAQIGRAVREAVPSTRFLLWVDFTAGQVPFAATPPAAP